MRNHSYNMIILGSKMERTIASLCKAIGLSLPLTKQSVQRDISGRKNTQITVHWQDVFVSLQRHRHTHRNGLLSNTGKPFGYFALTYKNQHLFFNQSRLQHVLIKLKKYSIIKIFLVVINMALG